MREKRVPANNRAMNWQRLFALLGFVMYSQTNLSASPYDCFITFQDTSKYLGYRLELTRFEILKRTSDWVRIRFTVTNTGRKDVDFSKKGTEHWVQINFDQSLFDLKLGGLRENIRYQLTQENFRLEAGQQIKQKELKVPIVIPSQKTEEAPIVIRTSEKNENKSEPRPDVSFSSKGSGEDTFPFPEASSEEELCADLFIKSLHILKQDDKWVTLEYSITNQGNDHFTLFDPISKNARLAIHAYISGAPVLSRGALPIGREIVKTATPGITTLGPGESLTIQVRFDIRKKTRYLKSLIISLESDYSTPECDKTNNTKAIILQD